MICIRILATNAAEIVGFARLRLLDSAPEDGSTLLQILLVTTNQVRSCSKTTIMV